MFEVINKKIKYLKSEIFFLKNNTEKEKLFDEIDDIISKIKQDINCCYDNMRIILDVINKTAFINNSSNNSISNTINIKVIDLGDKLSKLQLVSVSYYIDKGKYLKEHGKFNEAFDAWEEVLKIDPGNDYIHLKLKEIIFGHKDNIKNRADFLRNRYKFQYLGSSRHEFGEKKLWISNIRNNCSKIKQPYAFTICGKNLFIADSGSEMILQYDFNGKYINHFYNNSNHHVGLFCGENDSIWFCDFDNRRLLSFNLNGDLVDEIKIDSILNRSDFLYPYSGCMRDSIFYLVLTNKTRNQRKVFCFHKDNPLQTLKKLPFDHLSKISDVEIFGNNLYVSNLNPGSISCMNINSSAECKTYQYPYIIRRIFVSEEEIFFSSNDSIFKVLHDFTVVFRTSCAFINNAVGNSFSPMDIEVMNINGQNKLVLGDCNLGNIYIFQI